MRFLKSVLMAALLAFTFPAIAAEVECKRWDSKCVKAKDKAEKTQAIFMIFSAGREHNWDWRLVRDSFQSAEYDFLKNAGFDIKRNGSGLVRALQQSYDKNFEGMDDQTWNNVLTTIMADDYIAKQVEYKKLGIDVIARLKKELENSGKKTVKAKSGNFNTRSSSRPAVVVLDALEDAQLSLIKKLERSKGEIQVEVLAKALNDATIVLVEKGHIVAKPLRNPKQLEKTLIKASKSSGLPIKQVYRELAPAAAPAVAIIKKAVDSKEGNKIAELSTKQVKLVPAGSSTPADDLGVVIIEVSLDGDVILPKVRDYEGFTLAEIQAIAPEATQDDYTELMMDYARHANMVNTASIAADQFQDNGKGSLYNMVIGEVWDQGYQGLASQHIINSMGDEVKDLWANLKDIEARTKEMKFLVAQDNSIQGTNLADDRGQETDISDGLGENYYAQAETTLHALKMLSLNSAAAVLLSDDQFDYAVKVIDEAFKQTRIILDDDIVDLEKDLFYSHIHKPIVELAETIAKVEKSANPNASVWSFKGSQTLSWIAVGSQMVEESKKLREAGDIARADLMMNEGMHMTNVAQNSIYDMALNPNTKFSDIRPAYEMYQKFVKDNFDENHWMQNNLDGMIRMVDFHVPRDYHSAEIKLQMDIQASIDNSAELTREINKIQDAINNLDSLAQDIINQGGSAEDAAAYIADQEAQMRAGMAELCQAGDSSAC